MLPADSDKCCSGSALSCVDLFQLSVSVLVRFSSLKLYSKGSSLIFYIVCMWFKSVNSAITLRVCNFDKGGFLVSGLAHTPGQ